MGIIISNRHCKACNTSTGTKGLIMTDEDSSIDLITTEEEGERYVINFLGDTNQKCEYCNSSNWSIYNISINNRRLRRSSEVTLEHFKTLRPSDMHLTFVMHLHQYCLQGELKSRHHNIYMDAPIFSQSFLIEHRNLLEQFQQLFTTTERHLEKFQSIIANKMNQRNFSLPSTYGSFETVVSQITSYRPNDEIILELAIRKDIEGYLISLQMVVTEGMFKLFHFLTSKIDGVTSFVYYSQEDYNSCYYISIFENIQLKFTPIKESRNYFIKITEDILPY